MATDEEAFPRSVFRMEHCFIHDARGGNSVKSRAERNEIYSNWIEGALYHELELIGPDGAARKRAREDSDVVGNVIRKTGAGYAVRVGGDGSGESDGRYRFVNNTIVLARDSKAAFRLFGGLECVQMHNNAFARDGGGPVRVIVADEVRWATGSEAIAGMNNWVPMGSSGVPTSWVRTLSGRDPGFVSEVDFHLRENSPLIGAGAATPEQPPRFELATPLAAPRALPPLRTLERVGTARERLRGAIDIGAFSYAGPSSPEAAPAPPSSRSGCGCRGAAGASQSSAPGLTLLLGLAWGLRRKRSKKA
jgi:MYXO-CTERM domain-containing protein